MFDFYLRNAVAELLMPPGIWVLSILMAFLLFKNRPIIKKVIVTSSLVMIWVAATPFFAQSLSSMADEVLDWPKPLVSSEVNLQIAQAQKAQEAQEAQNTDAPFTANATPSVPAAIIVLGGGLRQGALELAPNLALNANQDVSKETMERLRLAARLAKQTQLPILVTGGLPPGAQAGDLSEAAAMARVLNDELGVRVSWIEGRSKTTQENATFSAKLLRDEKISHIYLVSQYWHLPRAQWIFEKAGFTVIPAPTGFESSAHWTPMDFYPGALQKTRQIWHELIGALWYRWRY
jgi:uncharacterized SAM-binding protein YcdF (DUF218 family)